MRPLIVSIFLNIGGLSHIRLVMCRLGEGPS